MRQRHGGGPAHKLVIIFISNAPYYKNNYFF